MNSKIYLNDSAISEKVKKRLERFEGCDAVKKWVTSVENRGKYQRDIDMAFYDEVKELITAQAKTIVLLNALQVGHLARYENKLKRDYVEHENKINGMYNDIKKMIEDYGNKD
tara:strand:+ start:1673 stop:2011 length:339 start_codon:yes stop_codon:yes gene_type:complete